MAPAEQGNTVKVHYTGTLDDGSKFDSSHDRQEPIQFTIGQQQMIPGFEQGVLGMELGDSKTINIPADQAYGPHDPNQIIQVERTQLPPEVQEGMQLQGSQPGGQVVTFTVKSLNETHATLDGNHPLAGQDLTFEIELVEIS